MPRIAFRTVGCRLNQAETAQLAALCDANGYAVVPADAPCDVGVLHGCVVTRAAERDSARLARRFRAANGARIVAIVGCAATAGDPALRASAGADLVVPTPDKFRLPALLHHLDPALPLARGGPDQNTAASPTPRRETTRAFLKVQDGCDFRCAYCLVPDARGAPISRPMADVLAEAVRLAEAGAREVILVGANLGTWRDGAATLAELAEAVAAVTGVARVRLGSIEVTTVERGVVDAMARTPAIARALHLPLQSGSDAVLSGMGRRYTAARYRAAIEYAVERLPRLGLGTDLLVGFPGETDADFDATRRLVEALPFSNLHVFPYSPRPGTRAAARRDSVPAAVAAERVRHLRALGTAQRAAFARAWLGQPVTVLVERVVHGTARGWSGEYVDVRLPARGVARNDLVTVTPTALSPAGSLFVPA